MQIALNRKSPMPLYTQLALEIQQRIHSGALPAGARLPTIRALSQQLGVTRLTIHAAYNELQTGGWIEATVGRGTFVSEMPHSKIAAVDLGLELSAGGVLSDMMRMAHLPGMRSLAIADGAQELYPQRDFARALEEALANGPAMLGYASPQGDPTLRSVLAEHLIERGITATPDEIIITAGVTQGLSLVAQVLAAPGDAVIVEQPTYLGALSIFGQRGLRMIGAPVDEDGLITEHLDALILAHQPRFIYVVPTFQNPTGACMSPTRRAQLLAIAARHQLPVIEDDIYARVALEDAPPPALYSEDRSRLVLNLSSFSKALMPGLRIGYLVAPTAFIPRLVRAKQANDLCSPPLMQRAMAAFIQHGWLANHLRRALPRYRERRDAMLSAMSRYFPLGVRWTEPQGGFCVWVALPHAINVTDLYLAGIDRSVAFTPGDTFFAGPAPRPYMRLAFSAAPPETITEAIRVLGELLGSQSYRRAVIQETSADYLPLV